MSSSVSTVLAAFYSDPEVITQACIAYVGLTLYRALATMSGAGQDAPRRAIWILLFDYFVAVFPFPIPSFAPFACVQHLAGVVAVGFLGAVVLHAALLDSRGLKSSFTGPRSRGLSRGLRVAVYAPATIVVGLAAIDAVRVTALFPSDPARASIVGDQVLARAWTVLPLLLAAYLLAAWRIAARQRLLLRGARLIVAENWMWLVGGAGAIVGLASLAFSILYGPQAPLARYSRLAMFAVALAPGLVQLRWAYDAVLRRALSFHILFIHAIIGVLGGEWLLRHLGLVPPLTWIVALTGLAGAATVLPQLVEERLERWFFPRAAATRTRLVEITRTPAAATRREAVANLLKRVVDAIDCEGAMIVLHATADEPAAIISVGRVDATPLGQMPADAARYLADLTQVATPLDADALPVVDEVRLKSCGVVLLCPLGAQRREGMLLLGPRRGWPYDEITLQGLAMLGGHAGLALENLTLVGARIVAERALAHGEKLAALGEAAARIAHEIRNPLAAARSLVQQIANTNGDRELVEVTTEQLDRIGRLVTDLLAFARREEIVVRADVNLVSVCEQALTEIAPLAQAHQVELEAALLPAVLRGDANRLVQVISNLCRNGVEALADVAQPRRLVLECTSHHDEAVVEIRDNGPGIDATVLAHLFEPFRTTKSSGTGLGLSIARRIVEAHDGRIDVRRTDNGFTIFRIELPRHRRIPT